MPYSIEHHQRLKPKKEVSFGKKPYKGKAKNRKGRKEKTCKVCKEKFTPTRDLQPVCDNFTCLTEYAELHLAKKAKEKKKQDAKARREFNLNDVKARTKVAKKVMQEYVRLRDINEPCISCRKPTAKQWDGGHYMSAEYYSAIRFNALNINKQCSHCNDWNNENKAEYRKHLIDKIGLSKVEWLEDQKQVVKYNAEYLNRLIKIFRKKIRVIKRKLND